MLHTGEPQKFKVQKSPQKYKKNDPVDFLINVITNIVNK